LKTLETFCSRGFCVSQSKVFLLMAVTMMVIGGMTSVNAAIRTSVVGGGLWTSTATWGGAAVPTSADDVIIISGTAAVALSTNIAYNCKSLTIYSGGSLNLATRTLNVAGLVNNSGSITGTTGTIVQGANADFTNTGTINISSNGTALTFSGSFINTGTLILVNKSITFSGNNTAASTVSAFATSGTVSLTRTAGTVIFLGNVSGGALTISGSGGTLNLGTSLNHTFNGAVTLTAGTLNGGTSNLNFNGNWSRAAAAIFTAGTGTVSFTGTTQTISGSATTFNNLTFAGSGAKTITTVPTVNKILSMEGTATISASPTYGPAATLQYKGTTTKSTTNTEFPNAFAGTGGVIIDQGSGRTITLNASKTGMLGNLTLKSGNLDLSTYTINCAGSGDSLELSTGTTLRIGYTLPSGYTTHSIDAGSTIEYYGTAQIVAALNSGQSYGNLLLSNSGTKTFPAGTMGVTGNITTAGTAAVAAGTGTVILNGAAQTISGTTAITFNNLTLTGSGLKTFTTRPSVNGIFSMEGTADASTYATLGASSTIQYKGTTSRTIGVEFPATFAGTGGVIIDQGVGNTITLNENKTALAGNLNIKSGTFDLVGNTFNPSAGGTLTLAAGTNLIIGGTNSLPTNYSTHVIDATSTVEYDGANQMVALLNSAQGYGNLILSGSGTKTLAPGTIIIKGDFENNGIVTNSTGNTLTLGGSTAQSIGGTTYSTFNNLTFNNTSGGVSFNIGETINGAFTINSSAIVSAGNYVHSILGNFVNSGSFNAGTGTIIFSATGPQSITGTTTFNNLTLTGSGIKTLTTAPTINGLLSMEGTATVSATVSPTFGSASTIQYKGTGPTITGMEFPATFGGSGGVIIDQGSANTVTLNAIRSITNGDLDILTGKLDLSSYTINRGSAGGTLTLASATTLRIGGANTFPSNYSTHNIDASSTIEYYGTSQAIAVLNSSQNYGNLLLSGSGVKTFPASALSITGNLTTSGTHTTNAGAALTIGGLFTIGAGTTFSAGSFAHNLNGNFVNTGTFTAGTSTFILSAAGAQSLSGTTLFNNLTIAGSGLKTLSTAQTVNGILSMEGTATVSAATAFGPAATIQYKGTSSKTISVEFPAAFAGTGGVIIDQGAGNTITLNENKTALAGNLTVTSGLLDLAGYTMNRASLGGTLTLASGTTLRIGSTNTFPSSYSNHSIDAGSDVEYYGTNQAVSSLNSSQSYGDLLLSGSGTKTFPASALGIVGNLTTSGSSVANAGAALTIGGILTIGSGTTFSAGSYSHSLNGDFANSGTFTAGTSTIIFSAAGAQSITGTTTFNNLTLAGSGLKTLSTIPTVSGILSMEGTATVSAAPTFGAASTIQYKGTTSRTIGIEFPAAFAGTGGIIIDQGAGNTITLNENKTALAGNLTLTSGLLDLIGYTMNRASAGGTMSLALGTTLRIGSTNTLPSNYSTHSINAASTVEYYGASQSISILNSSQNYGNLLLSGSGIITIPASVQTIAGNFTLSGTASVTPAAALVVSGAFTLGSGTFFTAGSYSHTVVGNFANSGTFTAGTSTFILSAAGAQSVTGTTTFNNLTLGGSGLKSLSTIPTVNGILSMEGTATVSAAPIFGAASTIQYKGTASRIVGVEFPAAFAGTGGVIIDQGVGNTITLNENKTALAGNLTLTSGSLDLVGYTMNRASAGGSLSLASATTLRIGSTNTLPSNYSTHSINTGSTIDYYGAAQTIALPNSIQNYGNLLLGGSGIKTIPAGVQTIAGNLTLSGTASVTPVAALAVGATFTIGSGTSFTAGSFSHSLVGNFTNSGTFTAGTGTIILSAAGAQSVSGTTTFNNLTIAGSGLKTLSTAQTVNGILSMEGTATVSAAPTYGVAATIQYKGTGSKPISVEFPAAFAGTGGVIINQGVGNTISLDASKTGMLGNLTITTGNLDLVSYSINRASAGGVLSLASGSTLRIGGTNTFPTNYSTHSINAGSTIEYSGTSQNIATLNSSQNYGNLLLSSSGTKSFPASALSITGNLTTSGTVVANAGAALTIGGTLTIGSGTTFSAGSFPHTLTGNFANSGTFTAGTSTIIFSAVGAQSLSGTTAFNNLTLAGSGLKTFSTIPTVNGILSMEGTATVSAAPTFGAASTIQYYGTGRTIGTEFPVGFAGTGGVIIDPGASNTIILNASKTGLLGNLNVKSGTFDLSTFTMNRSSAGGTLTLASATTLRIGGTNSLPSNYTTHSFDITSTVLFNGSGAQSIGGAASTIFGNLTLNNTSGITLSYNQTVNGVLTLTNGLLNTGSNTLTVGCSGSIANASAARYVNGKLALVFCSTGSRVFPIGKGGNYRPLTLNYTALTGTSTVTAEQIESTLPGAIPSDITIFGSRYWQLSQTGGSSFTYTLSLDGTGWSPTSYLKMLKGDGSTNAHYAVTTPNYTNSTAFTSFGNFGLGQLNCVTWLGTTNDWYTPSNWTSGTLPTSTDDIRIPSAVSFYPSIISGSDISIASAGKLQVLAGASLTLESGPLLTFQSGATVTTGSGSKIVLKSDARYLNLSTSTPTLEVQRQLTGTQGWRMVSSPVATTFIDMFKAPLEIQGFTGYPHSDLQPNLMWWDETDLGTTLQSWRIPSDLTQNIAAGNGYFHYVFNGAGRLNLNGTPSGTNYGDVLPITMFATGVENFNGTGSYNFVLTYTTKPTTQTPSPTDTIYYDLNALDQGWNLIGNPTASTLDWNASSGWTKTNVDNTIYIWDPSANGGKGNYLTWNGSTGTLGNGRIAPFQAFWVHAISSPSLQFTNAVKINTIGTFLRSSEVDETISLPITLSLGDMQTTSFLSFSEDGVTGPDRKDAYRLQSMSDNWLGLYSLSSAEYVSPLVINHLPLLNNELITIPLYYDAQLTNSSTNQSYTLNWKLPDNWPSDWNISLQDHKTETSISMTENASYSFGDISNKVISASQTKLPLPQRLVQNLSNPTMLRSSSALPPFTIVLSKGKNIDYIAPKPELLGNYPNPFEKATTIRFSLPEKAKAHVDLYTSQGQKIATLIDGVCPAGITEAVWNVNGNAPGLYFIRFNSGDTVETKKAVLIN